MGTVEFRCDLSQQGTALLHCWEHTVGSCHAPIALRADWQQQLRRCRSELGFRYVRFHGLLSDDVGTVVTRNGALLYSFFNVDQIIDFILSIGMRPFVELSFMPTALASGSKTVFNYRGNVTPPKDSRTVVDLDPKARRALGRAIRPAGSGGVVLRGVDSGAVGVRMTLTSPNCPSAAELPQEVERKVKAIGGVTAATVEVVFEPTWEPSMMSEAAKLQLNML